MRKMYEFIKEGNGRGESLKKAQCWLKNEENSKEQFEMLSIDPEGIEDYYQFDFTRPYHWAGFICSGVN